MRSRKRIYLTANTCRIVPFQCERIEDKTNESTWALEAQSLANVVIAAQPR